LHATITGTLVLRPDTPPALIHTLSLHDALPIWEPIPKSRSQFGSQAATRLREAGIASNRGSACRGEYVPGPCTHRPSHHESLQRSEEHTSELQSREKLVCRLLLEKKNKNTHKTR